mmetsp:Transcript_17433/g.40661  ORF Transcript_17433/g.40661 Transcript_17433/m.40661 type:complete len:173 (-) Transcript_17433:87-605(-)
MAGGVAFANDHQVYHCDVNPTNVLANEQGGVLLVDWACARMEPQSKKVTNAYRGDYQPPEIMGGLVDARTDVFGSGATLLWLLSGRTPAAKALEGLREAGEAAAAEAGPVADHPIAKVIVEHMGADAWAVPLAQVLAKSFNEDRDQRFETVAQLIFAVREALGEGNDPKPPA